MPYITKFVPAELYLFYKWVKIYRSYEDDDFERRFIYAFQLTDDNYSETRFDIRELSTYRDEAPPFSDYSAIQEWCSKGREASFRAILREAIDKGEIKAQEEDQFF